MDVAAVLAIIALLAAMIVPIFFLFRTQAHEKAKEVCVSQHSVEIGSVSSECTTERSATLRSGCC